MASLPEVTQRTCKFERPSDANQEVSINYLECKPLDNEPWPVILLIHGFPLTSHQFKHVLIPLAKLGFHCIAPDYTGAGRSSKPETAYSKHAIAADLWRLVYHELGITRQIHVVGHDIGGMIGHAYASMFPSHVITVTLGECPIPGTTMFDEDKGAVNHFHFNFHAHPDLAVALITGREELYMRYFFENQAYNSMVLTDEVIAVFVKAYSQPGALRAAALTYKAFSQDEKDNKEQRLVNGCFDIPALAMGGSRSHHARRAGPMLKQLYNRVESVDIEDSGHYIALENPLAFVREVARFVRAFPDRSSE